MEKIERIKKEIEGKIEVMQYQSEKACAVSVLKDLLSFVETVDSDLDKAAEECAFSIINDCSATGMPDDRNISWLMNAMINSFRRGALYESEASFENGYNQCRKDMERDAIDGKVCDVSNHYEIGIRTAEDFYDKLKAGDDVKVCLVEKSKAAITI